MNNKHLINDNDTPCDAPHYKGQFPELCFSTSHVADQAKSIQVALFLLLCDIIVGGQ